MERETFFVTDENGNKKEATVITRMHVDGTDLDYLIYSIDEEESKEELDDDRQVLIMAAKITNDENGNEILNNIEDDDEKQAVYEAFSESYNKAVQS